MSVSSFARHWWKRALPVVAVGMLALLALPRSPIAIFGTAAGDVSDPDVVATSSSGQDIGSTDGATPSPSPSASTTSTTSTGESPPSVTADIAGPLGTGGWYVDDVTLTWTVVDDETPVTSTDGCDTVTVSQDTAGATHSCTAVSDGGTTIATATIARDATSPTDVAVTSDIEPAGSGWFVEPFVATWSGNDATSGIAACSVTRYSGPDTKAGSLDGTCTDLAGNQSAAVAFAFMYDGTAPDVIATPDRPADHDGWYNHDLIVTWTSSDADATCDEPAVYASGDSETASVSGRCTDPAGNVGRATFSFRYDETAPTITLDQPADSTTLILNQPVKASFSCTDETSRIDSCAGTAADGGAIDTDEVGEHAFSVSASDRAGNTASVTHDYVVQYQPAGVECGGVSGHTILEPISKRSSAFKHGSTVPAKFRVCDWYGTPVTSNGVVKSFRIVRVAGAEVDEAVPSTSAHDQFRAGDAQWIFNIDTKALQKAEHAFRIALDDGTAIEFGFALR